MKKRLFDLLQLTNPWLNDSSIPIIRPETLISRFQLQKMLNPAWDKKCTILIGPRQAGKTTVGKIFCQKLLEERKHKSVLYINCDEALVREWLIDPLAIQEAIDIFKLNKPIFFIDEVQRLENPGLLLKSIIDLNLPIKLIASGSSQLEIKSKVQEHLTGRQIEFVILPFSYAELNINPYATLLYGCYPGVINSTAKSAELEQLYEDYFSKDIISFLKIKRPEVVQKLLSLIAHSSGQLVNYQQLATDTQASVYEVKTYLEAFENTFVLSKITPFVGNKRKEITSNPIYYFIDNGFRNQALRNFIDLESRNDLGLLIQSAIFQEILKFKQQNSLSCDIHFWRTKSNAEIDFVLYLNEDLYFPIEAKHRRVRIASITRSYRSFIEAYEPKVGFVITNDLIATEQFGSTMVYFIPFENIETMFNVIKKNLSIFNVLDLSHQDN